MNEAKKFSYKWNVHGDEKQETQKFWLTLLRDVFGIKNPENFIDFEIPVEIDGKIHFADAFIKSTKVLIEQKSFGKNLDSAFDQAKNYAENLPPELRPRFIITCNFSEFQIFDLDEPFLFYIIENVKNFGAIKTEKVLRHNELELTKFKPVVIKLKNFIDDYKRLSFLIDANAEHLLPEMQVAVAAVKNLKKLYKFFEAEYQKNYPHENFLDALNSLAVRLVYCFYASDAHIFEGENSLQKYLKTFELKNRNKALMKLFSALDSEIQFHDEDLKNFPYVNGGLFEKKFPIPPFTDKTFFLTSLQLDETVLGDFKKFNWRTINPTIFGAMFESILERNNNSRSDFQRNNGIYYTSRKNIHKLIDNLFLNDLHAEFKIVKNKRKNKIAELKNFQEKISQIKVLDPACGSGNFLTETYLSLRKLENQILQEIKIRGGDLELNPIKISVKNFFGIEIFSFGVEIAKTALWIAEHQMLRETEKILGHDIDGYLPLTDYNNIFCENSLQMRWEKICPKNNLNFIIGNPPFIGKSFRNKFQQFDMENIFKNVQGFGNLDYVACWFKKTADFIENTKIRAAFLATNSVCQGIAVPPLWDNLFDRNFHIDFAFQTFKWQNDLQKSAAVHCVIVAFSHAKFSKPKKIFIDDENFIIAKNINGYLQDEQNFSLKKRNKPLQKNTPQMFFGNMPNDNGNLILSEDEKNYFLEKYSDAEKFIKKFLGAEEFINSKKRFCFWFVDVELEKIKNFSEIYARVEAVRNFREKSSRDATKKLAEVPQLFGEIRQPKKNFILIPRVSSELRKYIPIGFLDENFIASDANLIIPDADLFLFGILESSVHMLFTKSFCGRLESSYRYSATLIYNNFPFPEVSEEKRKKITKTAEKILRVREKFEGWTLAKLYNEKTMPEELRRAHEENDLAVMEAYDFDKNFSEEEIVSALMILHKNLTEK